MEEQEIVKTAKAKANIDFLSSIVRGDGLIWFIYIALACLSLVEIFSATSQLTYSSASFSDPASNHIRNLFLGFLALLVTQSMSTASMKAWDKIIFLFGLVCFGLSFAIGIEQKGATRSIGFFQPVEFLKLGGIMMLCWAITAKDSIYHIIPWFRTKTQFRRYLVYLLIIFLAGGLITPQNLSSGLIIAMASMGVMFLGKVNGKYLWITLFIAGGVAVLALTSLKAIYNSNKHVAGLSNIESVEAEKGFSLDGIIDRGITWANRIYDHSDKPLWEEDITGKKSQEIYSHMALANGSHSPFGRFFGNSRLRDFLPEAFSDYIFAIIFEETGPVGAILVLIAYLALFIRCYMLSRHTQSDYVRLMILALPLIMVIQALIHIGVNTGAMFVTGQPLPLLSRGGSSIVCTSASFGMILALSRLIQQENTERQMLEAAQTAPIIEMPVSQGIDEMLNNKTKNDEISD